jgi:hypothetical protein
LTARVAPVKWKLIVWSPFLGAFVAVYRVDRLGTSNVDILGLAQAWPHPGKHVGEYVFLVPVPLGLEGKVVPIPT